MFSRDVMAGSLAHAPARPAATTPLVAEIVDLAWLAGRGDAWDRLSAGAVDPNPFFSRQIVDAHVSAGIAGPDLRFIVVHRGEALRALAPVMPDGARLGLRRAHAAWTSRFLVVNATPLVVADDIDRTLDALLDGAAAVHGTGLWRWPHLSLDRPVGQAIQGALGRRGWAAAVLASFDRPVLDPRRDYDAYARAHLSRNRRKRLQRQRDRLAEQGALEHRSVMEGEGLSRAVESFLALERGGWKGVRKTALASRPETAALARAAFRPRSGPVSVRADVLSLSGTPIAISLALLCGGTAYLLKTAYDERFRSCAPGLLLEDEIIRAFHHTGFAERLDSASDAGGVLESLYPDRERSGELVFSTDARLSPSALAGLLARERRIDGLRRALKRRYWRAVDAKTVWLGRRADG